MPIQQLLIIRAVFIAVVFFTKFSLLPEIQIENASASANASNVNSHLEICSQVTDLSSDESIKPEEKSTLEERRDPMGFDLPLSIPSASRQSFIQAFLHHKPVNSSQASATWLRWAASSDHWSSLGFSPHLQRDYHFVHLEHFRLSEGNKITNNSDLITAINNFFFHRFLFRLQESLAEFDPKGEIHGADSNFKYFVALIYTKKGSELHSFCQNVFQEALHDLLTVIQVYKLIRLTFDNSQDYGNIHTWYKLGLGPTADFANVSARLLRHNHHIHMPRRHPVTSFVADPTRDKSSTETDEIRHPQLLASFIEAENSMLAQLGRAEDLRLKIQAYLIEHHAEALLSDNVLRPQHRIFQRSLFEIFRKATHQQREEISTSSSNKDQPRNLFQKVQEQISRVFRLKQKLSYEMIFDIYNYIQAIDTFSAPPRTPLDQRDKSPSLLAAAEGGFATDLIRAGAENYYTLSAALAGNSSDVKKALQNARSAEIIVTTMMKKQRDRIQQTAFEIFGEDSVDVDCSFDDCVGLFKRGLISDMRSKLQLFLNRLASFTEPPMRIRVAFIDPGIQEPSIRSALAAHGLGIEMRMRSLAQKIWPPQITDSLIIGVYMRSTELHSGQVEVMIGNSTALSSTSMASGSGSGSTLSLPSSGFAGYSGYSVQEAQMLADRILLKDIHRLNRKLKKAAATAHLPVVPNYKAIVHF